MVSARRERAMVAVVAAMAAGAVVTIVGSLLPWLRTGSARRNSYDVFALADRLGFAPGGAVSEGLRWWPLVPLLVVAAVATAWWGWLRAGGIIGLLGGVYAGGVGLAVGTANAARVVDIETGAAITAAGGLVLAAASLAALGVGSITRLRPTAPGR